MKILKLYAWEGFFGDLVQSIRNKELSVLKANAYLNGSTCFIWVCAPFLVSLASFGMFVMIDENNVLDAKKAFVSVTLFNIIKQPFTMLPILISNAIQVSEINLEQLKYCWVLFNIHSVSNRLVYQ